jgi:hypothetical protein
MGKSYLHCFFLTHEMLKWVWYVVSCHSLSMGCWMLCLKNRFTVCMQGNIHQVRRHDKEEFWCSGYAGHWRDCGIQDQRGGT